MALLRQTDASVTDVCLRVGFASLGTFSHTFGQIVGVSPTDYRATAPALDAPVCFVKSWTRPSSFEEAPAGHLGLT